MKASGKRSGPLNPRNVGLVLLALVLISVVLLALREARIEDESSRRDGAAGGAGSVKNARGLAEAPEAQFFSVISFQPGGKTGPAYMIGSGTGQFDAVAQALANAQPVEAATDESFDRLLVIAFGRGDTLDVSYSSSRNLIIVGEQAYTPAADLAPVIATVEGQFN